jgi:hypothetical protein
MGTSLLLSRNGLQIQRAVHQAILPYSIFFRRFADTSITIDTQCYLLASSISFIAEMKGEQRWKGLLEDIEMLYRSAGGLPAVSSTLHYSGTACSRRGSMPLDALSIDLGR